MRLNWKAIGAGLVTTIGVVSDPHVLGLLAPHVATAVTVGGIVLQAVTKGVQHGDDDQ